MGTLKRTFLTRLGGDKPSVLSAFLTAVIVGIIVAVITYKLLRS